MRREIRDGGFECPPKKPTAFLGDIFWERCMETSHKRGKYGRGERGRRNADHYGIESERGWRARPTKPEPPDGMLAGGLGGGAGGAGGEGLEEGRLVDVVPGQRPEEAAPEPTAEERLRADVDFLAAVTGVEL